MTFNCNKINLKRGNKGKQVTELQKILQTKGYYKGKIDGEFGEITEKAVKALQKQQGNTPNGWFGPKTCNKLQKITNNNVIKKSNDGLIKQGKIIPVLEKVSSIKIKDYKTLYKAYANVKYSFYNNDIYTFQQELERILSGKGLNCTDQAQSADKALDELNFPKNNKRIVRGIVTCKNGTAYGHVWLQLYLDGKWVHYDPSAISAHGYPIGDTICKARPAKITNINPSWALTDDGKT